MTVNTKNNSLIPIILLQYREGHHDAVTGIFVDDRHIYTASRDGTLRVSLKESFEEIMTLQTPNLEIVNLFVDHKYIYYVLQDNMIYVCLKDTLEEKFSFHIDQDAAKELDLDFRFPARIQTLVYDSRYIYTLLDDFTIRVWSKETFKEVAILWVNIPPKMLSEERHDLVVDDQYIYCLSPDGIIHIWFKKTFREVTQLQPAPNTFLDPFKLIVDDQYIYTVTGTHENNDEKAIVHVWSKKTFQEVGRLEGCLKSIRTLQVDKHYIFAGCGEQIVQVWSKEKFQEVARLEGFLAAVWALQVDDRYIYTVSRQDKLVYVWSKGTFEEVGRLKGHTDTIKKLHVDAHYIYTLADDGVVRVWSKEALEELAVLKVWVSNGTLLGKIVDFKVDGDYIYGILTESDLIYVWSKKTFQQVFTLKAHWCYGGDHRYIYTTSDGTVRVWLKDNFQLYKKISCNTGWVSGDVFSEGVFIKRLPPSAVKSIDGDSSYLYIGLGDGDVKVWSKEDFQLVTELQSTGDASLSLHNDEQYVYVGHADGMVRIWSKDTFKQAAEWKNSNGAVLSLYGDEANMYVGCKDGTVRVWSKETFELVAELQTSRSSALSLYGDEQYVYVGHADGMVRIWSKDTFKLVAEWKNSNEAVLSLYGDEANVYVGCKDGTVRVRSKATFQEKMVHKRGETLVEQLYNDDDGIYATILGKYFKDEFNIDTFLENSVYFWDKNTLQEKIVLSAETEVARVAHVIADEYSIYIAFLYDGSIKKYDKSTVELVTTIEGHEDGVKVLYYDKQYFYTASEDGKVKVWDKKIFSRIATLDTNMSWVRGICTDSHHIYLVSGYEESFQVEMWSKETFRFKKFVLHEGDGILPWVYVDEEYVYVPIVPAVVLVVNKATFQPVINLRMRATVRIGGVYSDNQYLYVVSSDYPHVQVWEKGSWREVTKEMCKKRFCGMYKLWLWVVAKMNWFPHCYWYISHVFYCETNEKRVKDPKWLERCWKNGVVLEDTVRGETLIIINGKFLDVLSPALRERVEKYKEIFKNIKKS